MTARRFQTGHVHAAGPAVLVFNRATGFVHDSIPAAMSALERMAVEAGFRVNSTDDPESFSDENLRRYDVVVFLHTSGEIFGRVNREAFVRFVRAGGGFVGVHTATATEKEWEWFARLAGAVFVDHPQEQEATLVTRDAGHPSTQHLPQRWRWTDEWYNFESAPENVHVLLQVDESTYTGGRHGKNHPVAWCQDFEGGRSFVTCLGHDAAAWTDERFRLHVLGGLRYAARVTASRE